MNLLLLAKVTGGLMVQVLADLQKMTTVEVEQQQAKKEMETVQVEQRMNLMGKYHSLTSLMERKFLVIFLPVQLIEKSHPSFAQFV